ncbi:MAG: M1 family aminopeptidase [Acidobacteriota bacterium]
MPSVHAATWVRTAIRVSLAVLCAVGWADQSIAQPDTASPDPRALLEQVRSATVDLEHPLDPSGLRLSTGFATLDLTEGVLFPVRTAAGQATEMVFIGRGQASLDPPDNIEAGQLELFTGSRRLAETFTEAVFVIARNAAARSLLLRPAATDVAPEVLQRAAERYAKWNQSPERRTLGVETGILLDALSDPLYEDYFAGWFLGESLGPFLLQVDPAAEEQINLGQFVRFEVSAERQQSFARYLHQQQQRGKLTGLEIATLGRWDSWIQAPLQAADGTPRAGSPSFEPQHYVIDVRVDPNRLWLTSETRVTLRVASGGRRVVRLELHRDLEITRLTDRTGVELFYLREGKDVNVLLPKPLAQGSELILELGCEGTFFDPGKNRDLALRNNLGWYPRTGANERATYDVTLHWPHSHRLLASGTEVAAGEADGLRWQQRKLDVPALGFSFEIGLFDVWSLKAGDIQLHLALDPATLADAPEGVPDKLVATIADSLVFYESLFGPYPLDELVVVTVPRQTSQALLGFVTLSGRLLADWGVFGTLLGVQDRSSVVAHEIAHQWWGHLVGWRSYRDQWISEAMANYAALLWARRRGLQPEVGPITGWQQELTATLEDGRPIESLGPLVLGQRLFSSRSQDAYHAIVYRKGALVLEMLAQKFGEEDFLRALAALVKSTTGKVISTSDFLDLLEVITSTDLDAFARQFIFGTGLPEIYYDYAFEPLTEGKWKVRIQARQELPSRTRYGIVTTADGTFDVERRRVESELSVEDSELVVPFQILLVGESRPARSMAPQPALVGRLVISGRRTDLELEIEQAPRRLWLDRDREVFGKFLDRRRHPKRMLMLHAQEFAANGELEQAIDIMARALAARSPLGSTDHLLDAHLHLTLSGWRLDRGDREAATAELRSAERALAAGSKDLPRSEARRFVNAFELLRARLEIHRGDFEAAFERLDRNTSEPGGSRSTEAYLLLAIAAQATGRQPELDKALAVARQRGADFSALLSGSSVDGSAAGR